MKVKILELDNSNDFIFIIKGKNGKQYCASFNPSSTISEIVSHMKKLEQECNKNATHQKIKQ